MNQASSQSPHPRGLAPAAPSHAPEEDLAQEGPPVNGWDILAKVLAMPISTWHYKTDPPGVRHLGPMAQDWKAAFELGDTDKIIWCVDINGVALVSVQALHQLIGEVQETVTGLQTQVTELTARLDDHAATPR